MPDDALDDLRATRRRPRRERRRRWPWVLGIVGGVLLVVAGLGVAGVALAGQALDVRDELEAAKSEMSSVTALVKEGDTEQFAALSESVLAHTAAADDIVQGPLWEYATWVPGVGPNIAAVRAATSATHILVRDALPATFEILATIDPDQIRFADGGFNLEPFRAVLDKLPAVDTAFAAAQQQLDGVDRARLLPIVDEAVGEVLDVIDETSPLVHTATAVLPTVLNMLGGDGPRSYYVMFQNNAEIRATGGNPAAAVVLTVDGGRVSMSDQTSSATFNEEGATGRQLIDIPAETLDLYFWDFAQYTQNYTRTPNFPLAARMFQAALQETGVSVDGVISLDPVALSHMLEVTGPVSVAGVELNAENAVRVLLNETYITYPNGADSDAFFAAASASIFGKLVTGSWDPLRMIDALRQSVREQRVYGWFTREDEEAAAVELGIDGHMAGDNTEATEVGIFLNDHGVGKMQYYLSTSISVACSADTRQVTTTLTMTNTVDRTDLTEYILSRRTPTYGAPRTSQLLDVLYVAPPGAGIDSVSPGQGDVSSLDRTGKEEGRVAESIAMMLDMGETLSVSYTSTLPDGDLGPIAVRHTPTVTDTPVTIEESCTSWLGASDG